MDGVTPLPPPFFLVKGPPYVGYVDCTAVVIVGYDSGWLIARFVGGLGNAYVFGWSTSFCGSEMARAFSSAPEIVFSSIAVLCTEAVT